MLRQARRLVIVPKVAEEDSRSEEEEEEEEEGEEEEEDFTEPNEDSDIGMKHGRCHGSTHLKSEPSTLPLLV
ncbi:hypothetical protein ACJ72_03607 [Emergomyces africanus]|uniref:Uncharacterized protein n=1 Tax=Emergomyces africanus TaxID=1955775 RepID=A0A1B7NZ41_9EURO|nr:hypothetical protein ACJ72_03607 [Emergomyces africanus]